MLRNIPSRTWMRPAALMLALVLAAVPGEVTAQGAKKSDAVVKVSAKSAAPGPDGKQVVTLAFAIDEGWHLYANPVGNKDLEAAQTVITVAGVKPDTVKVEYPAGTLVKDNVVGDYFVYEGKVTAKATVQRALGDTGPLEVTVKLQACTDKQCLLPATVKLTVPPGK